MADNLTTTNHVFFHVATTSKPRDGEDFVPPVRHKLRAVSILLVDGDGNATYQTTSGPGNFFQLLDAGPRLVSWNGRGFGLPVLTYEALRRDHTIYNIHHGPKQYMNRYAGVHVDMADEMSFRGAAPRVTFDEAAKLIGLPGRLFDMKARSVNYVISALEIDVAILALAYCRWYRSDSSVLQYDGIQKAAVKRCRRRLKDEMTGDVKRYLKEFRHV